jgi:hypothetical protein
VFEQPRWSKWALLNLVAGYVWISLANDLSFLASLPPGLLGAVFAAVGLAQLLWPGDLRSNEIGALAALVAAVVSIPYALAVGFGGSLAMLVTALAAGFGAGRMAFQLEHHFEGVPVPEPTPSLIAKVAVDEAILGYESLGVSGFPLDGTIERVIDELSRIHVRFAEEGFLEKPEAYHQTPPPLLDPEIVNHDVRGHSVDFLRFESGYAPPEGEPGRDRWMGYEPCRDGHAYVLRHEGPPRPWLICTNGYRMGHARMDVGLLHGPRRLGLHSGSGFIGIDLVDTLHAEAQSIWDMRRLLSWVEAQGAPSVGAYGLSLGGYTTSLFASVAEGLDCVIAGIPLADFTRMIDRHGASHQMRYAQAKGYDLERAGEVLRVVSPLALEPKVARENRMIFGATADRLVTPDQVRDLWHHWEQPEIVWYSGSHISFMGERAVWSAVDRALRDAGVAASAG